MTDIAKTLPADQSAESATQGPTRSDLILRFVNTMRAGQFVRLSGKKCTIGSAAGSTLCLRTPLVRAAHCLIVRGDSQTIIRNLASDSRINGRIYEVQALQEGDRISVGPIDFELTRLAATPDEPLPSPLDPIDRQASQEEPQVNEANESEPPKSEEAGKPSPVDDELVETVATLRRSKNVIQARTQRLVSDLNEAQEQIIAQQDRLLEQQTQLEFYQHQSNAFEERLEYLESFLAELQGGAVERDTRGTHCLNQDVPANQTQPLENGSNASKTKSDTAPWPVQPSALQQDESASTSISSGSSDEVANSSNESIESDARETEGLEESGGRQGPASLREALEEQDSNQGRGPADESELVEVLRSEFASLEAIANEEMVNEEGVPVEGSFTPEIDSLLMDADQAPEPSALEDVGNALHNANSGLGQPSADQAKETPSTASDPTAHKSTDSERADDETCFSTVDSDSAQEAVSHSTTERTQSELVEADRSDELETSDPESKEQQNSSKPQGSELQTMELTEELARELNLPYESNEEQSSDHQLDSAQDSAIFADDEDDEDPMAALQADLEGLIEKARETESIAHEQGSIGETNSGGSDHSPCDVENANDSISPRLSNSPQPENEPIELSAAESSDSNSTDSVERSDSTKNLIDSNGDHDSPSAIVVDPSTPQSKPIEAAIEQGDSSSGRVAELVSINSAGERPDSDEGPECHFEDDPSYVESRVTLSEIESSKTISADELSHGMSELAESQAQDSLAELSQDETEASSGESPDGDTDPLPIESTSGAPVAPQLSIEDYLEPTTESSDSTAGDALPPEKRALESTDQIDSTVERTTSATAGLQPETTGVDAPIRQTVIEAFTAEPIESMPESPGHVETDTNDESAGAPGLGELLSEPSVEEPAESTFMNPAPIVPPPSEAEAEVAFVSSHEDGDFGGSDEEESIEEYMAKLLKRVRGDEATESGVVPAAISKPKPAPVSAESKLTPAATDQPSPLQASDAVVEQAFANELSERQRDFDPAQVARRTEAPERRDDLAAMREVANSSARSAIKVSQDKREANLAYMQLAGAIGATLFGAALIGMSDSLFSLTFLSAFGFWGIGGVLAYRCFTWYRNKMNKLRQEGDSPSLGQGQPGLEGDPTQTLTASTALPLSQSNDSLKVADPLSSAGLSTDQAMTAGQANVATQMGTMVASGAVSQGEPSIAEQPSEPMNTGLSFSEEELRKMASGQRAASVVPQPPTSSVDAGSKDPSMNLEDQFSGPTGTKIGDESLLQALQQRMSCEDESESGSDQLPRSLGSAGDPQSLEGGNQFPHNPEAGTNP